MFPNGISMKNAIVFLLIFQEFTVSSALLYIVRQTCNRGTVFTPAPSTTSNICLQCVCVMSNISYCKPLIVQLSVVCSAALVTNPVIVVTTVAPTTTRPTAAPTIPAATATTAIGINPRASTPAASAMMNASPSTVMVTMSPLMMMIMAASAGAAGVTMPPVATVAPPPTPAPAGR